MGPDLIVWTMVFRNYDDLFIGDRYPKQPPVFDVTQEVVDRFRAATLGANAVASEGPGLAPTMLAGVYTRSAIASLKGGRRAACMPSSASASCGRCASATGSPPRSRSARNT